MWMTSAIKDVDDAGKLEHVEYEHCDGERTCNHGHREPSRAIKSHQEPSRAIKGHQEPFVHPSPIRKLSLYERQHAPRWTSRVDRWKALAWASSHRDLSSSTSRFCSGARVCNQCNQWQSRVLRDSVQGREPRDRRSAIMAIQGNHGNPRQSKAIQGNQGGSSASSHLRIGEQPIDSLFHNARHLLRRLHQTDHATIARDPLWPRVLPHQFP
jgi:hypothetical protein